MNMRWMKLESTTFCTLLYFLLIRINKAKIVFSVCFLNYPCNKKYPENKISPNALKIKYVFSRIFENIWHWELIRGASTWPRGSRARPPPWSAPCLVGPWWLPSTYPSINTLLLPPKKSPASSSTSSSSPCCHFRSPCSKLHSQNCFGGLFFGM